MHKLLLALIGEDDDGGEDDGGDYGGSDMDDGPDLR